MLATDTKVCPLAAVGDAHADTGATEEVACDTAQEEYPIPGAAETAGGFGHPAAGAGAGVIGVGCTASDAAGIV